MDKMITRRKFIKITASAIASVPLAATGIPSVGEAEITTQGLVSLTKDLKKGYCDHRFIQSRITKTKSGYSGAAYCVSCNKKLSDTDNFVNEMLSIKLNPIP